MNCNVSKEKVRIAKFVTIRSELQCLKGYDPNYNIYTEKVQVTLFVTIRSELQCL